ncbi:MAG: hypothetical protein EPN25_09080 [Nitrospirae bacterium]|nr:MAG: hypothetical protein EPN25_09080 [Nitrospirota bacterium]
MRFILLILVIAAAIYAARLLISALFGRSSSPATPVVLQPPRLDLDISISDEGKDGMPVITIRSNAATLNIQAVQQEAGRYGVSAEKQADNVAVISINKKPYAGQ